MTAAAYVMFCTLCAAAGLFKGSIWQYSMPYIISYNTIYFSALFNYAKNCLTKAKAKDNRKNKLYEMCAEILACKIIPCKCRLA